MLGKSEARQGAVIIAVYQKSDKNKADACRIINHILKRPRITASVFGIMKPRNAIKICAMTSSHVDLVFIIGVWRRE